MEFLYRDHDSIFFTYQQFCKNNDSNTNCLFLSLIKFIYYEFAITGRGYKLSLKQVQSVLFGAVEKVKVTPTPVASN